MMIITKLSLWLFLATLSFNAAFAVSALGQVYVITSFMLFMSTMFVVFVYGIIQFHFKLVEKTFICFLVYLTLVTLIFPSEKGINYLIVYVFFFLCLPWSIWLVLENSGIEYFAKCNYLAVGGVCLFVLFEVCSFQFFGFDVHEFIPRIGPVVEATVFGFWRRAYGFSNEPTNLSSYLVTMGGLSVYFSYTRAYRFRNLNVFIIITSLLLTFSGSAFGGLIAGIIINFLLYIFYFQRTTKARIFALIAYPMLVIAALEGASASGVLQKFTGFGENFGSGRGLNWLNLIGRIVDNAFLPAGLGVASSLGFPATNTYLMILFEAGLVGLLIFVFALVFFVIRLINLPRVFPGKMFLFLIFIASVMQMGAYDTFYYPYCVIFMVVVSFMEKQLRIKTLAGQCKG